MLLTFFDYYYTTICLYN